MDGSVAYEYRLTYRVSWNEVADVTGYSSAHSVRRAARTYASRSGLPWPIEEATKGAVIYTARRHRLTWMELSRIYDQPIAKLQRRAYRWSKRRELPWPPQQF